MTENKSKLPAEKSAYELATAIKASTDGLSTVFSNHPDFREKIKSLDHWCEQNAITELYREVFFDLLMVWYLSSEIKSPAFFDSLEWEKIEDESLDRGTELLNVMVYLNDCADVDTEPEISDFLYEFMLADSDEFQDEFTIYEPFIKNLEQLDSVQAIQQIQQTISETSPVKELFVPIALMLNGQQEPDDLSVLTHDEQIIYQLLRSYYQYSITA